MKALITGSTSGIGKAIKQKLQHQYEIICLNSRFEDINSLHVEVANIAKVHQIDALIHCAGFGMFEPLESMSVQNIQKLLNVNLLAPMIITSLLLRNLKKNKAHIVSISSIEALKHSKFSAVYTASKAGLRAFSLSLFEEVRKSGVKVTNINPDITNTNFFDKLHFKPSDDEQSFLNADEIALMVLQVLSLHANVSEITLQPQKFQIQKNIQK